MYGSWSLMLGIEFALRAAFNPDFTLDASLNLDSGIGHSSSFRAGRPSRLGISVTLVQCQRSVNGLPISTPAFESVATGLSASTLPVIRSATVDARDVSDV